MHLQGWQVQADLSHRVVWHPGGGGSEGETECEEMLCEQKAINVL